MTAPPPRPRRRRFRRTPLGRWASRAGAALFMLAVAPFLLLPADWHIRAFGRIGRLFGPLPPMVGRVREGMAAVRPGATEPEVRALAAEVGDNFGRVLAEYVRMAAVRARPERRRVHGLDHLRAAVEAGRGAMIVSAHYGNWEAIRLAARDAGIEVALIYRAFNNPDFDALARTRIRLAGEPVLTKGAAGMRGLVGRLKAGGAILILLDQRMTSGAALPFLGRPALTTTAPAALAARIKAPLIPARAVRDATGLGFDVTFEPPVPPDAPETMMGAVNDRFSAWVDERPGQWWWLHRRWAERRRRS